MCSQSEGERAGRFSPRMIILQVVVSVAVSFNDCRERGSACLDNIWTGLFTLVGKDECLALLRLSTHDVLTDSSLAANNTGIRPQGSCYRSFSILSSRFPVSHEVLQTIRIITMYVFTFLDALRKLKFRRQISD